MEEGTRRSIQRERNLGGKIKAEKKTQNKSLFYFPKITMHICMYVCSINSSYITYDNNVSVLLSRVTDYFTKSTYRHKKHPFKLWIRGVKKYIIAFSFTCLPEVIGQFPMWKKPCPWFLGLELSLNWKVSSTENYLS